MVGFDLRYAVSTIGFEGDVDGRENDYGPGQRPDMYEEALAPFGDVRGAAKSVEQLVSADDDRKRHGHFFGIERTDVERQECAALPDSEPSAGVAAMHVKEERAEVEGCAENIVNKGSVMREAGEIGW